MRLKLAIALTLGCFATTATVATAKDIVITGSKTSATRLQASNTKRMVSRSLAYSTVDEAIQSGKVKAGDRLLLADGTHGGIVIRRANFTAPVTITAASGAEPHVEFISVLDSSNIVFSDLNVWATMPDAGVGFLIRSDATSAKIKLQNLDIRSVEDATDFADWPMTTWEANKRSAVKLDGPDSAVTNSTATGVFNGFIMDGTGALLENNIIRGFGGDAMRALGSDTVVRGNLAENCYAVFGVHTDGLQSYTVTGYGTYKEGHISNLTVENNTFLDWNSTAPAPYPCKMQGIFMKGSFDNVKIRNNMIRVSSWNGISMTGPQNTVISHNTVVNTYGTPGQQPGIRIVPWETHNSRNLTVANNAALDVRVESDPFNHVLVDGNYVSQNLAEELESFSTGNLRLKTTSRGVDAGLIPFSTAADIEGTARYKGQAPDAGAYEVK